LLKPNSFGKNQKGHSERVHGFSGPRQCLLPRRRPEDYPALLSTCHSLRDSIADGYLLDYLIIDEASQVNLLLAGLAMSCARNVVVVGDQRQLPPIPVDAAWCRAANDRGADGRGQDPGCSPDAIAAAADHR
jgi:hypothetical protein